MIWKGQLLRPCPICLEGDALLTHSPNISSNNTEPSSDLQRKESAWQPSPLSFPGDAPSSPGGTACPLSSSTVCHQDRFKMSLEPSVDSSPSGQGPVSWERQKRDRILGQGYVRGERGGLDWATSPQNAISLSSRNIGEAPTIICMPGPGLLGECLHSLSSGAYSLAGERNRERGAFTRGKSRARRAPGSQRLGEGLPHPPRNGRSSRPQDAPLVLLPTSLPLPKQCLPRGEPSGPQPRERRRRAHCREKRPALWTLSPEGVPSEGILQSLSSATLGPSSAPDPARPHV